MNGTVADVLENSKQPEEISNLGELFKYCTDPSGMPGESWEFYSMKSKQTRGWCVCAHVLVSVFAYARALHMQVSTHMSAVCTAGNCLILHG